MSEPLVRFDAVPGTSFVRRDVTIHLAPPMARYSLRARQASDVEAYLGATVPDKIGLTIGNIACLGPDEWLYRAATGARVPTNHMSPVAVTDISERSICLIVEGLRAAQVLMSGCPLDIEGFTAGRVTRTIYEGVEILVIQVGEDCFHIEVWRSFAPWLWRALTTASCH